MNVWCYSCERQTTFEQARASILSVVERKAEIHEAGTDDFIRTLDEDTVKFKEVDLTTHINEEFFHLRWVFNPGPPILPAKLIHIKYHNSQWRIELEGTDNRGISPLGVRPDKFGTVPRIKATEILNDNYEIIEVIAEDFVKQTEGKMR